MNRRGNMPILLLVLLVLLTVAIAFSYFVSESNKETQKVESYLHLKIFYEQAASNSNFLEFLSKNAYAKTYFDLVNSQQYIQDKIFIQNGDRFLQFGEFKKDNEMESIFLSLFRENLKEEFLDYSSKDSGAKLILKTKILKDEFEVVGGINSLEILVENVLVDEMFGTINVESEGDLSARIVLGDERLISFDELFKILNVCVEKNLNDKLDCLNKIEIPNFLKSEISTQDEKIFFEIESARDFSVNGKKQRINFKFVFV